MNMKEMLGARFLINDKIDYEKFLELGDRIGLTWADGSEMNSSTGVAIGGERYPFVLETTKNGEVMFDRHLAGSTNFKAKYAPKTEMPMTLLINKKNPGITVTLEDGREFVYDIEDALAYPDYFHDWLKDVTKPPIKVGDIVRITDCGQLYTTYLSWFKENKVDIDIAARYAYANEVNPPMNADYEVVAVGQHVNNGTTLYAIAQKSEVIYGGNPVYLISGRGVRMV